MFSSIAWIVGSDSQITEEPRDITITRHSESITGRVLSRTLLRGKTETLPLYNMTFRTVPGLRTRASTQIAIQDTSPMTDSERQVIVREEKKSERYTSSDTIVAPSEFPLADSQFSTVRIPISSSSTKSSGTHPPDISDVIENFIGVTSYEYERYDRNVTDDKYFWDEYMIDPLETDFSRPESPDHWEYHVHPDGGLYFGNNSQYIPVLTDIYVYDISMRIKLEKYITQIFAYITKYDIQLPSSDVCLVLEFRQSGRCGYYFVDHTKQCLFWLEKFDALAFLSQVRVRYTPSLVGQAMKSLYWLHNETFPDVRPFPHDACEELEDILIHAIGDSLTSPSNTAPYNSDVLEKMLRLVKDMQASKSHGTGSSVVIYRFLHNFYHERLLHLHGERAARLNINQSIHPKTKKTLFFGIVSPLLLFAPEVYLRKLQEISTDSLVHKHTWEAVLQDITGDWKDFTLFATVLLNANVAFLAIQSVDSSASPDSRSIPQRASYFSIMTSIGTIVLGLILARQHQTTLHPSFLVFRSASVWGLETLALMYSLPHGLLMWGMISFLVAFSAMCFNSHDIFTLLMVSLTTFILGLLLLWCISISFEDKPYWSPWILRNFRVKPKGILAGRGSLRIESGANPGKMSAS